MFNLRNGNEIKAEQDHKTRYLFEIEVQKIVVIKLKQRNIL